MEGEANPFDDGCLCCLPPVPEQVLKMRIETTKKAQATQENSVKNQLKPKNALFVSPKSLPAEGS